MRHRCAFDTLSPNREMLVISYPVERRLITNWDDMQKIWNHTFEETLKCVVGAADEADEDVRGVLVSASASHKTQRSPYWTIAGYGASSRPKIAT